MKVELKRKQDTIKKIRNNLSSNKYFFNENVCPDSSQTTDDVVDQQKYMNFCSCSEAKVIEGNCILKITDLFFDKLLELV